MFELLLSLVSTPFGIGAIVAGAAAAAAPFIVPGLGLRMAAALAVVALTLAGCGYVHRLTTDLAAAEAKVEVMQARLDKAVADAAQLASTAQANAESAKQLADDNERQALAYAADAEQARSDADYFLSILGRRLDDAEADEVRATILKAYRWQYIVSGSMEPRFQKVVFSLVDATQGERIVQALAPLAYAVPQQPSPLAMAA